MASRTHPRKISIPMPTDDDARLVPALHTPEAARMLLCLEQGRCSLGPLSDNSPRKNFDMHRGSNSSFSAAVECQSPRGAVFSFTAQEKAPTTSAAADANASPEDSKRPWTEEVLLFSFVSVL